MKVYAVKSNEGELIERTGITSNNSKGTDWNRIITVS